MIKTTALFIWDQPLAALIHLNFITLILICFKLMMPGVNYVIYSCSSAITTGVSLYWSFTLEENVIAVITQGRVIDDNLKRQLKTELCVLLDYSYQPKFFNILAIVQRYFSFHPLCSLQLSTFIASQLECNFFHCKENNFAVNQVGLYINWANTSLFFILGKLPTLNQNHPSLFFLAFCI